MEKSSVNIFPFLGWSAPSTEFVHPNFPSLPQAELDLKRLRDPLQLHLPVQQINSSKDWWEREALSASLSYFILFCLFAFSFLSVFLCFVFISTTSMKNHIHSKLQSFIIILYIISFNLASLCRGEEIQLNEMTKLHPWTDDRCLRIRRSHNATGVQEVGTLGFKQYIAMRQWPQVLHGTQTLRSKNHLPLGWTVFFPHWSTADIPNSDTLQKRFLDVVLFSNSEKVCLPSNQSSCGWNAALTPVPNSLS